MGKLGVVIGLILLLGLVGAGVWYASAPGTPPKKVLSEQEMLDQISNEPSPLPANANFDDAVKYLKTLEPKFAAFRVGETYTLSKPCFGVINSQDVYEFARQLIRPKEPGFMQMHQKGKTMLLADGTKFKVIEHHSTKFAILVELLDGPHVGKRVYLTSWHFLPPT